MRSNEKQKLVLDPQHLPPSVPASQQPDTKRHAMHAHLTKLAIRLEQVDLGQHVQVRQLQLKHRAKTEQRRADKLARLAAVVSVHQVHRD